MIRSTPLLACLTALAVAPVRVSAAPAAILVQSDDESALAAAYLAESLAAGMGDRGHTLVDVERALAVAAEAKWKKSLGKALEHQSKGQRALDRLKLRVAARELNQTLTIYERNVAHLDDLQPIVDLLTKLASVQLLAKKDQVGMDLLIDALAISPDLHADSRLFNPSMRDRFEQAVFKLKNSPKHSVTLTSEPSGARVYLDGKLIGVTPTTLDEITGRHYLRVRKDGWHSWGKVIQVKEASDENANLDPTDRQPEMQALLDSAIERLDDVRQQTTIDTVFRQLGDLLGVQVLYLGSLRARAGQVDFLLYEIDLSSGTVMRSSTFGEHEKLASDALAQLKPVGTGVMADASDVTEEDTVVEQSESDGVGVPLFWLAAGSEMFPLQHATADLATVERIAERGFVGVPAAHLDTGFWILDYLQIVGRFTYAFASPLLAMSFEPGVEGVWRPGWEPLSLIGGLRYSLVIGGMPVPDGDTSSMATTIAHGVDIAAGARFDLPSNFGVRLTVGYRYVFVDPAVFDSGGKSYFARANDGTPWQLSFSGLHLAAAVLYEF